MKVASNTAKLLQHVPLPDEIGDVRTNTAVIDIGSYLTRVGFSGDNYPRLLERTSDLLHTHSRSSHDGGNDAYGSNYSMCNTNSAYVDTSNKGIRTSSSSSNNNNNISSNKTEINEVQDVELMHHGNIVDWDKYEELMCKLDDILCFSKRSANSLLSQSLYNPSSSLSTPSPSSPSAMHEMPLLFTEKALVTHKQRERVAQMLFETFDVPKIQFALSPSLSLYAAGLSTGVGVEMGHEQCHVVPVFQGISWFHSIHTFPFGGAHLTQLFRQGALQNSLNTANTTRYGDNNIKTSNNSRADGSNRSYHNNNIIMASSWTAMKERYCCVAQAHELYLNLEEDVNTTNLVQTCTHTLPDGMTLKLDSASMLCAEALFTPELFTSLTGTTEMQNMNPNRYDPVDIVVQLPTSLNPNAGIHELLVDAIQKCDADIIPQLYENIVLSGGTSMTRNLPSRLQREVQLLLSSSSSLPSSACVPSHAANSSSLASSTMQHINSSVAETVCVHAMPERQHASFVGASILASLPTFEYMWITRAEHDEHGSKAIRLKCLD